MADRQRTLSGLKEHIVIRTAAVNIRPPLADTVEMKEQL
jgi:hypothetical protein